MGRNIPSWVWALALLSGVGGIIYLLYKYFISPADILLQQYKKILEDIYEESRDFLYENKELDPPIYGLTVGQEAIINAKKAALADLEPKVMDIIEGREESITDFFYAIMLAVVVAVVAPSVVGAIKDLLTKWMEQKPEASANMQSAQGQTHLLFELLSNELAARGDLNVASGFYAAIPSFYTSYTEPSLVAGINYYTALLPTLIPGTIAYIVAQQLLNYMTYEINAVTGIMPVMHAWWLPPLVLRK